MDPVLDMQTAAKFSLAAYALAGNEVSSAEEKTNSAAESQYASLESEGWIYLTSSEPELGTLNSGATGENAGFFVVGNAAALVAVKENSLVLSFRGTNDDSSIFSLVPGTDRHDWRHRDVHFLNFADAFLDQVRSYLDNHTEITNVLVTGHSLGAAMVDALFSSTWDLRTVRPGSLNVEGINFADPGYDRDLLGREDGFASSDLTTINFAEDTINFAGDLSAQAGDFNEVLTPESGTSGTEYHAMTAYLSFIEYLTEIGISASQVNAFDGRIFANGVVAPSGNTFIVQAYGATLYATDDNHNLIIGGSGADAIYGGLLSDQLYGGTGVDDIRGGGGGDRILGGDGSDTIYGGDDGDDLRGEGGADTIRGEDGEDDIYGGDEGDYLYGDEEGDLLKGESGNDHLWGGTGNDDLYGDEGDDRLYGEGGNDTLYGGQENDYIYGGSDNDTLVGNSGSDLLDGETGTDLAELEYGWREYTLSGTNVADFELLADGDTDRLVSIERLQFSDRYFSSISAFFDAYDEYQNPTPPPSPPDRTPSDGSVYNADIIDDTPPTSNDDSVNIRLAGPTTGTQSSSIRILTVNDVTGAPGEEIPLTDLFPESGWYDGLFDGSLITWFAVQDRDVGSGGYLTYKGDIAINISGEDYFQRPISEIDDWAYRVGPIGETFKIGFDLVQSNGVFNASDTSAEVESVGANLVVEDVEVMGESLDWGEVAGHVFEPGDTFSVEFDVRNIGQGDAGSSEAGLYFYDGDDWQIPAEDTNPTQSLSDGSQDTSEELSFRLPSDLADGTYLVAVYADHENEVIETEEGVDRDNLDDANLFAVRFTVQAPPPEPDPEPDLDVRSLDVDQTTWTEGDTVSVDWIVENQGTATASSTTGTIYLSTDSRISTDDTPIADSGGTGTLSSGEDVRQSESILVDLDAFGLAPGTYYVGVIADADNDLDESRESNNDSSAIQIELLRPNAAPDFTVVAPTEFAENATHAVAEYSVFDRDSDSVVVRLEGADSALFSLSGNAVVFNAPPDFETPLDSDGNNTYEATLVAQDEHGAETERSISVSVTDVDETPAAPEITVEGNGSDISDGDTSPSTADGTSFGSVVQGGSAIERTFTVSNDGTAALTLGSVDLPSGFALVEGLSSSIAAGGSDSFTVRMNTDTAGSYSGEISFTNNDGDENPYNFSVSGTVTVPTTPEITVESSGSEISDGDTTPSTTDGTSFGSVVQGGAAVERTFTVSNDGTAPLSLGAISLPNGFTLVEELSSSIAAGGSDSFTVRLNTGAAGSYSGQISFTNNDADENPYNFAISGSVSAPTGAPDVTVTSFNVADTTIEVGDTLAFDWTVQNVGAADTQDTEVAGIYISTDALLGDDDLLAYQGFNQLAPEGTDQLSETGVALPAGYGAGTYWIYTLVGTGGGETNLTNNTSDLVQITVSDPTPTGAPDVTVTSFNVADTTIEVGDTLAFDWTVQNVGDTDTQDTEVAGIYISTDNVIDAEDRLLAVQGFDQLSPGGTDTLSETGVELPADLGAGRYWVYSLAGSGGETNLTNNTSELVQILVDEPVSQGSEAFAETGVLAMTHDATTVTLERDYDNPVVIAYVATENGAQPVNVRVRNIEDNSLTIQLQEPNYLDGSHVTETVTYLVVEAGIWELPDGTLLEAGSLSSDMLSSEGLEAVDFDAGFDTAPVILSQVQTLNGSDFVTTRQDGATADGFQVTMQEEEAKNDGGHKTEVIGWVAIEAGSGSAGGIDWIAGQMGGVTDDTATVELAASLTGGANVVAGLSTFNGSDTAWARGDGSGADRFDVSVEEEQSSNDETNHIDETVDYFAFSGAGTLSGTPVAPAPDELLETGMVTLTHRSTTVTLQHDYDNPVVIAYVATENGNQPVNVRVSNIDGNDLTLQLQEPDYLDGRHTSETVNYVVVEAGTWVLADGTILEAGALDSDKLSSEGFETVDFDAGFEGAPVILSQVQTLNGSDFVTTRQNDATADGFQVTMQEQESKNDGAHKTETIGWIAIEAGSGSADGFEWIAGQTSGVTNADATVDIGTSLAAGANVVATLSTFNGSDPAWARGDGSDADSFDVSVEEDQSRDSETNHIAEGVDYFVFNEAGVVTGYEYGLFV